MTLPYASSDSLAVINGATTTIGTPEAEAQPLSLSPPHYEHLSAVAPDEENGGNDDDAAIVVLLRASRFQKDFGRGRQRDAFSIDGKYKIVPPPPLDGEIPDKVWRRFVGRLEQAKWAGTRRFPPWSILFVPWTIFLFMGDTIDDRGEDVPVWLLLSFVSTTVLIFGCAGYADHKANPERAAVEERAVVKMRYTFAKYGYAVEYHCKYDCCICPCSFVEFTRIATTTDIPQTLSAESEDRERQEQHVDDVHGPGAWEPLLGTWQRSRKSFENPLQWLGHIESETWEFRRVQHCDEEQQQQKEELECCKKIHIRLRYKCRRQRLIEIRGQTSQGSGSGQTLFLQRSGDDVEEAFHKAMVAAPNEEACQKLRQLRDDYIQDCTFYPVAAMRGGHNESDDDYDYRGNHYKTLAYYRNKSGSTVWKVEGSTVGSHYSKITVFMDLEDDWITDADILRGCLQQHSPRNNSSEDRKWVEFEKVSSSFHDNDVTIT